MFPHVAEGNSILMGDSGEILDGVDHDVMLWRVAMTAAPTLQMCRRSAKIMTTSMHVLARDR